MLLRYLKWCCYEILHIAVTRLKTMLLQDINRCCCDRVACSFKLVFFVKRILNFYVTRLLKKKRFFRLLRKRSLSQKLCNICDNFNPFSPLIPVEWSGSSMITSIKKYGTLAAFEAISRGT